MGGFRDANLVPTKAAVGAASAQIIAANDDRSHLLLINDSDSVIYVTPVGAAVLNEGIRLNAGGGNYEISTRNGNLHKGALTAISSGAGKNLLMLEGEEG